MNRNLQYNWDLTAAKAVISEEVHSPKGFVALQRALEASAEIDDDFTRDTLADLVSRRLSVRGATRLQVATKLACDVVADLTEEHLRLLAFLAFTQNLKPLAVVDNVDQWTDRVIEFLVVNYHRLKVAADPRDLNLIVSAGLATLFPGVVGIDLKATYVNAEGFIPNIDSFLANDDLGKELKAAYTPTQHVRLNLVGQMLGITTFDKIVGQVTDLSGV